MSDFSRILLFLVSCVFTQNIVFARALGFTAMGDERRVETAAGYGLVVALAMTLSSALAWLLDMLVLVPAGMIHLRIVAFALAVLVAVWLVEKLAVAARPALAESLGGSLMPVAANCALLGIAVLNYEAGYTLGQAVLSGLFGGLGFLVAIVLMAGVQERLETSRIPEALKGMPIALISASLIALAFMGFTGIA